jgi:hypothetical protein
MVKHECDIALFSFLINHLENNGCRYDALNTNKSTGETISEQ